jgi:hypothetical protein
VPFYSIDTKTRELLTGVCTSLEEELNDYFRSGKRKEQQMLEEEDAEQRRSQSGLWGLNFLLMNTQKCRNCR